MASHDRDGAGHRTGTAAVTDSSSQHRTAADDTAFPTSWESRIPQLSEPLQQQQQRQQQRPHQQPLQAEDDDEAAVDAAALLQLIRAKHNLGTTITTPDDPKNSSNATAARNQSAARPGTTKSPITSTPTPPTGTPTAAARKTSPSPSPSPMSPEAGSSLLSAAAHELRLSQETTEWRRGIRAQVFHRHMMLRRCWDRWLRLRPQRRQDLANYAVANSFRDALLMKQAFELWRQRQQLLRQRQADGHAANAFHRSMQMHAALRLWQRRLHLVAELRRLEQASHPHMDAVRARAALQRWWCTCAKKRLLAERAATLQPIAARLRAHQHLQRWRARLAAVRHLYSRLASYTFDRTVHCQRRHLHLWRAHAAHQQRVRAMSNTALQLHRRHVCRNTMSRWRTTLQLVQTDARMTADFHTRVRAPLLLLRTLHAMRVRAHHARQSREREHAAYAHRRHNLLSTALAAWRLAHDQQEAIAMQPRVITAIRHHQRSTLTRTWLAWHKALTTARRIAPLSAIADHHWRMKAVPTCLAHWRTLTKERRHARALDRASTAFRWRHVQSAALDRWRERARGRMKERELLPDADALLAGTVLVRAFRTWRSHWQQQRVRAAQVEVAACQHEGWLVWSAWRRWHGAWRQQLQLQHVYTCAAAAHERWAVAVAWRRWQGRFQHRQHIASVAVHVTRQQQQRLESRVWDRWRALTAHMRTQRLSTRRAMQQRHLQLQRRYLHLWRARCNAARQAAGHHNAAVMRTALRRMQSALAHTRAKQQALARACEQHTRARDWKRLASCLNAWRRGRVLQAHARAKWERSCAHDRQRLLRRSVDRRKIGLRVGRSGPSFASGGNAGYSNSAFTVYMERLALSMWAFRLQRKYFARLVQSYHCHRHHAALRQRVLEWRTAQLQRIGLQHIVQLADTRARAIDARVVAEGGRREQRRHHLMRWAVYRWRAFVGRARHRRAVWRQGRRHGATGENGSCARVWMWAGAGGRAGGSVLHEHSEGERDAGRVGTDGGGDGGGDRSDDGDGDGSGRWDEAVPMRLSPVLRRARMKKTAIARGMPGRGGNQVSTPPMPPLWPNALASHQQHLPMHGGLRATSTGAPGDVANTTAMKHDLTRNAVATLGVGACGTARGREQDVQTALVKMRQILQHGVDLRLEIASLQDLLDVEADCRDRGEIEAILRQKQGQLKRVLLLCTRWRQQQQLHVHNSVESE
ncbi:hypothetical protein PTSG_10972 [Salpingoeca rosetta]|uniref:Sfi1 spindle body domain-containing protein n=1 Tax=Salpingoeca rosetta (strain ATCC 50818 / BSB-021) TaxID=946362 RepID=F2USC0_SALR5|nr:uncharacterized protein PTSG_10972 [Salpingoeca rosetta]EGD81029.1 hypothetical protein PTSG_10972 [Salpingoeca rosetta]|eukprot:XP_004987899.1 hypothetical protein PTSG_10972 [Salpingoeca rosetta]